MKVLVTGGLGFVGSHFVRCASEEGAHIVVLDDGSAGSRPALPKGVRVQRGDIGDQALVEELLKAFRPAAVVHFAGKIQVGESVRKPGLYFDHNMVRALRMLETMVACDVNQIVFSSTAAVYGEPETMPIVETERTEPTNAYGAAKLAFEGVLRAFETAHGLRWAAPRYFNAAGAHPDGSLVEAHDPETHLIPLVVDAGLGRRGPLTIFGDDYPTPDGTCVRDYVHVCDLARAHLAALAELERGRTLGPFNLGTGVGSSVRQVIDTAAEVLGKPIPHAVGARRAGDPPSLVADPSRAKERLGWKAESSQLTTLVEDCLRSRR